MVAISRFEGIEIWQEARKQAKGSVGESRRQIY